MKAEMMAAMTAALTAAMMVARLVAKWECCLVALWVEMKVEQLAVKKAE